MRLRLAYPGATNAFAILRPLPTSNRDKDVEILALRHQITVLQHQLGTEKPRFATADRAFLATLRHRLPRDALRRVRLPVRPDTVLRCTAIEHASPRIRILGATAHPTASWVAQAAKNLIMGLEDTACRARFVIGDRGGKFPALFDAVLADAGINIVLSGIQIPGMNSITKRWVQTCRRELLDPTPIWNQRHLHHALREFEQLYNSHRPHQRITNARPLRPLPPQIVDPDKIARLDIRRRDRLGGILHEYEHAA